jgi:hypothetical protein
VLRVETGGSSEVVIADSTDDIIGQYQYNQVASYQAHTISDADQGVLIALYLAVPNWCAYNLPSNLAAVVFRLCTTIN